MALGVSLGGVELPEREEVLDDHMYSRCLGQAMVGTASRGLSWTRGSGFPLPLLSLPGCFVNTGNNDGES